VANYETGIHVIDVSDPENPWLMCACDTPNLALGVWVTDTYAFAADYDSGLQVIEKFKPLTDQMFLHSNRISATVPEGFRPGTYNLFVTNPDGKLDVLRNALNMIMKIDLSAGLNGFGCPVKVPTGYTSYHLIRDLGSEGEIEKIQKYDPNTMTYKSTIFDPNGMPCGDEYEILNGQGYLVYMKEAKSIFFSGLIPHPPIACQKGLNIVSVSSLPYGYTSYDLLTFLGSSNEVASIQRINQERGISDCTFYFFGRPAGKRFNIVNGEAYLIRMKVPKYQDIPK
jgi:hypothetical protein